MARLVLLSAITITHALSDVKTTEGFTQTDETPRVGGGFGDVMNILDMVQRVPDLIGGFAQIGKSIGDMFKPHKKQKKHTTPKEHVSTTPPKEDPSKEGLQSATDDDFANLKNQIESVKNTLLNSNLAKKEAPTVSNSTEEVPAPTTSKQELTQPDSAIEAAPPTAPVDTSQQK